MSESQRWALGIEYDGCQFCGFQIQKGRRSVQQALEHALSVVANHTVSIHGAGRTDTGVHATGQVIHFDSNAIRSVSAWQLGGNSHLPEDVRITWVKPVPLDFHARYSAIARLYRYVILNHPVRSALQRHYTTWHYTPLNEQLMHRAAQALVGSHDFSSFRAQGCQSKSPYRDLHYIAVHRQGEQVIIDIAANAFLHHMVRNIIGVLMEIGANRRPENWIEYLLQMKDRNQAAVTAPPQGLFLAGVFYGAAYDSLPSHPLFAHLPADVKRFD